MPISSSFTLDVPNSNSVLTINEPSGSYLISYSGTHVTLGNRPAFNLSKSDFALHASDIANFNNILLSSFPTLNNFVSTSFPVCMYQIQRNSSPNTITFDYQSAGVDAVNITYNLNSGQI